MDVARSEARTSMDGRKIEDRNHEIETCWTPVGSQDSCRRIAGKGKRSRDTGQGRRSRYTCNFVNCLLACQIRSERRDARRESFERRTRFNPRERRSVERCRCDERWRRMGESCHPKSGVGEPRVEKVGILKSVNVGAAGTWIRFGASGTPLASTNELRLWRSYEDAWIIQKQIPFRVSAITKNAPVERCSEQNASRV